MPLRLYRGDSYSWQVRTWADEAHTQAIDLAGATAAAQLEGPVDSLELVCSVELPNLIDVELPAASWNGAVGFDRWDLQLTWDDGRVFTLLSGPVTVTDDVTP
jgi:hypothetical protein